MLKRILNFAHPVLKPLYKWYKSKPRNYSYKGIKIKIHPGVFHPGLFFSTLYLLEYALEQLTFPKQKILELGAGSGLISVYLSTQGHDVYASDINPDAVKNIAENARTLKLNMSVFQSDLFDDMPPEVFDCILINPPYYPKNAQNKEENAWYCGENFEYFDKLFSQMKAFVHERSNILMVLSEDCDLKRIKSLADKYQCSFQQSDSRRIGGEENMIFQIKGF